MQQLPPRGPQGSQGCGQYAGCATVAVVVLLLWRGCGWFGCSSGEDKSTDPVAKAESSARSYMRGDGAEVIYELAAWNATSAEGTFLSDVTAMAPVLLQAYPQARWIGISGEADFTDVRGNVNRKPAFYISFWRENAETIRWSTVDPGNLPRLADKYWFDVGVLRGAVQERLEKENR